MNKSSITTTTAIVTLISGVLWSTYLIYSFLSEAKDASAWVFMSFFYIPMLLPGFLAITFAILLYKRSLFINLKSCIGILFFPTSLLMTSWIFEYCNFYIGFSFSLILGSILYYFLARYLCNRAGFIAHHASNYLNKNLPALISFILWADLNSLNRLVNKNGSFSIALFLLSTAACYLFCKWTSRLIAPNDESELVDASPLK